MYVFSQDYKNIRPSVSAAKLTRVVSLAMENRIFYWTDGIDVYFEEYNQPRYYHNTMTEQKYGHYKKVFINSPSFQPWPTPINPPTNVQAIFGRDIAKTRWQPPHLVGVQGKYIFSLTFGPTILSILYAFTVLR